MRRRLRPRKEFTNLLIKWIDCDLQGSYVSFVKAMGFPGNVESITKCLALLKPVPLSPGDASAEHLLLRNVMKDTSSLDAEEVQKICFNIIDTQDAVLALQAISLFSSIELNAEAREAVAGTIGNI